jgi:Gly-Xaa carboxypeptidase
MSIEKKEKGILPSSNPSPTPAPKSQQRKNKNEWIAVVMICFLVSRTIYLHFWHATDNAPRTPSNNCPQADALIPEKNGEIWIELNDKIGSAAFKQTAIDWLAGAVRIP